MVEKTVISFKVSEELKVALAKLAAADERSLSSYIDRILRNHVAEQSGKPAGKKK
jgi:predicted transcriptional regulator